MFCKSLRSCIFSIKNINQPGSYPVFKSISGSTEGPGQFGTIFYDKPICAYEVFTVPTDRVFVLEYVSAVVTRGNSFPYPSENKNDYGAVGYELDNDFYHTIPFARSEPGGILQASQMMRLYIPSNARVVVKVPVIQNQTGGAEVNVSGYYLKV